MPDHHAQQIERIKTVSVTAVLFLGISAMYRLGVRGYLTSEVAIAISGMLSVVVIVGWGGSPKLLTKLGRILTLLGW